MRLLNRISISQKLTLFGVTTTVLVLLLMAAALGMYDLRNIRVSLEESYGTMADVVGQSCAAPLLRTDREEAARVLKVLDEDPSILAAELLKPGGEIFMEYMKAAESEEIGPLRALMIRKDSLKFERSIHLNGQHVGDIRVKIVSDRFWNQWREHLQLLLIVTMSGILMAAVLAAWLQQKISAPVLHLVETARAVSATRDYSRRARRETDDEFGELCGEFNKMLVQIETRDAELEMHRRHLESLVSQRTEALEQKTREALAASVAKSEFLANMSHEIRTPMNAILGFTDLLQLGQDSDDERLQKEYLDTIATSGRHLLTVINDVLDLSKIEAGKLQVERIQCSPHQIIAEAISVLRVRAHEKGLRLDFNWDGPVPREIHSDPVRLKQLLINLIGNAIKFTEEGGVQVTASLMRQNHQRLRIDVIDTGMGIAADKLNEIFTPFSQADASVTRRFGGTGLGLSISRHIAEALDGELLVESEVGRGSTFTAIIETGPLDESSLLDAAPTAEVLSRAAAHESPPRHLGPGRVLLVEDGETNRKLIRIMLSRHGLEIVEAGDGRTGMDLALSQEFDVVLMDMQMPVMDGYRAARELRMRGFTTPIIALTAHAMAGDADRCLEAGCSDYLSKPISEARLVATLSRYLQSSIDQLGELNQSATTVSPEEGAPIQSSLPVDDLEFREIVVEFVQRLNDKLADLITAAGLKDWEGVAEIAHWIRGSGGTAGFDALTLPAGRLERIARQGCVQEILPVIGQIEAIVARIEAPGESSPDNAAEGVDFVDGSPR